MCIGPKEDGRGANKLIVMESFSGHGSVRRSSLTSGGCCSCPENNLVISHALCWRFNRMEGFVPSRRFHDATNPALGTADTASLLGAFCICTREVETVYI